MTNTNNLERQIIELIAADRIDIPISSMSGKLKRMKPNLAKAIILPDGSFYQGERVYARVEDEDKNKARGMKEAIELFSQEFPKYGKILNGMIEKERALRETHLYFGTNEGKRLTADDYLGIMQNLGFGEVTAKNLYEELIGPSRIISKKREQERSIMIGSKYL